MKSVIFDMDGLMIDTEGLYFETEREIAKSFGKEVKDETLWKMMGRKSIEAIEIFKGDLELHLSAEDLLRMRDDMFEKKLVKEVIPMPGLFEMLNEFKGRYKLAIATGSPKRFLDIVSDKLNLEDYFDVMQSSDEIKNGKPDPEIYLKAIERLEVLPKDCVVLEDSSNGALAAKRAGCYTIAIPSEYTFKQEFGFVDYVAVDLNDARFHIKGF